MNFWRKFKYMFRRERFDRDLKEEMRLHVDLRAERLRENGLSHSEANVNARRAFGNTALLSESSRKAWTWQWLEEAGQDLRYGFRKLCKSPGFTVVSIFTLALGIGANTATFTAYKAMVARPLDARDPAKMVNMALVRPSGTTDSQFSYPDYEGYRDHMHSLSALIASGPIDQMTLSGVGEMVSQRTAAADSLVGKLGLTGTGAKNAEFASVMIVSENYFSVLGALPVQGRTFESISKADMMASPVALITENYWQKRFGGDPSIVGKTVRLNGAALTIVGITPHDFVGISVAVPDFWIPISLEPLVHPQHNWLTDRENQCCRLFGRLNDSATIAQAQTEMIPLTDQLRALHDPNTELSKPSTTLVWLGSPFPLPLKQYPGLMYATMLIMGAVGMVLVVACANVASLQLARAASRQDELRIRLSLGASRARIIRQLLTESALLGAIAGLVALVASWALLKVLVTLAASALPLQFGTLIFYVTPDLGIFAYVLAISLVASILFGLAPAFESSRSALPSSLRSNSGTSAGRGRRLQNVLVAAQVAISLALLIAGSILIRSSINSLKVETGYDTKHVVNLDLQFPEGLNYTTDRKAAIVRELRMRLAALPGVAAVTSGRAPNGKGVRVAKVSLNGEKPAASDNRNLFLYSYVQPDYFDTIGIPLLFGRGFKPQTGQPEHYVIVSESAGKRLWPGQNPIGMSMRLGTDDQFPNYQVIGVVGDTRGGSLDGSDTRQLYVQLPDDKQQDQSILIRTQSDPAQLMRAVDELITSVDRDIVVTSSTLEDMLRSNGPFIISALAAIVASAVGLLGLLLASMGIYGTVNYLVALRTREVGIRMAIGAQKRDIMRLILRESVRPVLIGLLVGVLFAVVTTYLLRGVLFGLNAFDGFVSLGGVSLLFLVIALTASYPPSRRATRIDPMVALRCE